MITRKLLMKNLGSHKITLPLLLTLPKRLRSVRREHCNNFRVVRQKINLKLKNSREKEDKIVK
jgi:hypothetical protein